MQGPAKPTASDVTVLLKANQSEPVLGIAQTPFGRSVRQSDAGEAKSRRRVVHVG